MNRYKFTNGYKKPPMLIEGMRFVLNEKGMKENKKRIDDDIAWSSNSDGGVRITNTLPDKCTLGKMMVTGIKENNWTLAEDEQQGNGFARWEAISEVEIKKYYEQI